MWNGMEIGNKEMEIYKTALKLREYILWAIVVIA